MLYYADAFITKNGYYLYDGIYNRIISLKKEIYDLLIKNKLNDEEERI